MLHVLSYLVSSKLARAVVLRILKKYKLDDEVMSVKDFISNYL